jgi:hypothetical protein
VRNIQANIEGNMIDLPQEYEKKAGARDTLTGTNKFIANYRL